MALGPLKVFFIYILIGKENAGAFHMGDVNPGKMQMKCFKIEMSSLVTGTCRCLLCKLNEEKAGICQLNT